MGSVALPICPSEHLKDTNEGIVDVNYSADSLQGFRLSK